jgi:hypothetical protein
MSRSRIVHSYEDVTIDGEWLRLGPCLALRAFEQEGIVSHLLWHGVSFFLLHPKDRPIQSPLVTCNGMPRTFSNPNPNRTPFSRLLWHARGSWSPILTQISMGMMTREMPVALKFTGQGRIRKILWARYKPNLLQPRSFDHNNKIVCLFGWLIQFFVFKTKWYDLHIFYCILRTTINCRE